MWDGYVLKILIALGIFLFGWFFSEVIGRIIRKAMRRVKIEKSVISFTFSASKIVLKILSIFFMFICFVDAKTVFTAAGTAVVALSFIFKDSLSNMMSGITIISNKLFKVEDYIKINENSGYVSRIELFFTTLVDDKGSRVIIPNSMLTSSIVSRKKEEN
jgi:small conductance mechanosensitive channel